MPDRYDAVVVGAGPNGLAAAVTLARDGRSVLVLEGAGTVGGGTRSAELTLPGVVHDVCSAFHPLLVASPFFRTLPLTELGIELVRPEAAFAHPLDDGTAVVVGPSVAATADDLGEDARAWRRTFEPMVRNWQGLAEDILAPLRIPHHPFAMGRFGLRAVWPASRLIRSRFSGERARAALAGVAAHSMLPLQRTPSGFPLMMVFMAHALGWPVVRGGSQRIADGMASYLRSLGGEVVCDSPVRSLDDVPASAVVLFDVTPKQLLEIAGDRLVGRYREGLERYRYGPGVVKCDWVLDGPIPWKAQECLRAGTVHLGGSLEEIEASETDANAGRMSQRPYVLLGQQSLFDDTRAPSGQQVVWAYCHVPSGTLEDASGPIEAQIERFAPGFADGVVAKAVRTAPEMEAYNPNYVGGDINGGAQDLRQHFTRPVSALRPYATSDPRLFLCSSSTPPGGGVHGMCGYWAARAALRRLGG